MNLEPEAKENVERLLRTVLTLVELLQRKNASIFGWRAKPPVGF